MSTIFNVENLQNITFKELLKNSKEYHDNLLHDPKIYKQYHVLEALCLANNYAIDKESLNIILLNEIKIITPFEEYVINCIKSNIKESIISYEFKRALINQIQYLRIKAITHQNQLEFIEFMDKQLYRHAQMPIELKGNIFFSDMFHSIMVFIKNNNVYYDNLLYKNFCINLKKKYPNIAVSYKWDN